MRPLRILAVVTTAVVLCLPAASASSDEFKFGKITDADWNQGPPIDYPDADAIVIREEGFMIVDLNGSDFEYHVRIKILTEAGIDEVADRSVFWHDEYDKLKKLEAHTITPDGKKHKVEKDNKLERSSGDYREKVITFPAVSVGSIIEYKYRIIRKQLNRLRPWYFQGSLYTLHSQFSVKLYPGFTYNVVYANVPGVARQAQVKRERLPNAGVVPQFTNTFTWSMSNLTPVTDEPYMAAEDLYRSSLRFQLTKYESPRYRQVFFRPWDELGKVFDEHWIGDYVNKRGDIEDLAKEVTAGITDPADKSRALYEYVRSNYRTVYDAAGSFDNEKISKLLETKSGSGQEKNVLLMEMHRALGIDAWSVLIGKRRDKWFDPDICDLLQFNYLITFVKIGDNWEFLDAASPYSPYGILPPSLHAEGGLMIDGDNSQPVRLIIEPQESCRSDHIRVFIDEDGAAICSTTSHFSGYYASGYASRYDRKSPEEFIQDYYLERVAPEATLGAYNCALDSANCFTVTLDFEAEDMIEVLDDAIIATNQRFAFTENPFKRDRRFFPIDFTYPFTYQSLLEIHPPDTNATVELPEDMSHSIGGLAMEVTSFVQDGYPVVATKLTVSNPEFLPADYSSVKYLFQQLAEATEKEVVISGAAE